ncbi:MAG: 50S ribosomal protein L15 [Eubacteriales bacterium]|nr:50S ribosomal protein L15 [Eubacteriales bacterium]
MKLNDLSPNAGSRPKSYRKGRGHGSGNGKTSGRGHKGQGARSGGGTYPAFEGGQMPLYRRLPKRGFNNKRFAKQFIILNVEQLNSFEDGSTVDVAAVREQGLISIPFINDGIKILGDGELEKKLTVKAAAFTKTAREKIEKAGGTAEEV